MAKNDKGTGSDATEKVIIVPCKQGPEFGERSTGGTVHSTVDTLPPPPPLTSDSDKK